MTTLSVRKIQKILQFDVASSEKIQPYQSGRKNFCDLRLHLPKKFRHTKVREKLGRINGDKIHPYKSGKRTTLQRQENFNVTSVVKIHPYKSEGESVSNVKYFRHIKVGEENSCEQLRQNVPHTIVGGDTNAERMTSAAVGKQSQKEKLLRRNNAMNTS